MEKRKRALILAKQSLKISRIANTLLDYASNNPGNNNYYRIKKALRYFNASKKLFYASLA